MVVLFFGWLLRLNLEAVRRDLQPVALELERWLAGLEEASTAGGSAEAPLAPPHARGAERHSPAHGRMKDMRFIEARYEEGLLRPETPLALTPGERVALVVVRQPDPRRWDLDRLGKSSEKEDRTLSEQGLGEWAEALDQEDESGGR